LAPLKIHFPARWGEVEQAQRETIVTSVCKKFRAVMAGKKLVLMPGAYDALSARING